MAGNDPWQQVSLNENGPNPMSPPQQDPHWRGIIITAPKQVTFKAGQVIDEFGAFAAVPLCAYQCFDMLAVPVEEYTKITATDVKTGTAYEGDIVELDPGSDIPIPEDQEDPPTAEELKGMAYAGWLNPNLTNFVAIPQVSATYEVFMSYRGFKSNKVTIELIKK